MHFELTPLLADITVVSRIAYIPMRYLSAQTQRLQHAYGVVQAAPRPSAATVLRAGACALLLHPLISAPPWALKLLPFWLRAAAVSEHYPPPSAWAAAATGAPTTP